MTDSKQIENAIIEILKDNAVTDSNKIMNWNDYLPVKKLHVKVSVNCLGDDTISTLHMPEVKKFALEIAVFSERVEDKDQSKADDVFGKIEKLFDEDAIAEINAELATKSIISYIDNGTSDNNTEDWIQLQKSYLLTVEI
jgi:hypothetical protein